MAPAPIIAILISLSRRSFGIDPVGSDALWEVGYFDVDDNELLMNTVS
jgi:hypothetical protein